MLVYMLVYLSLNMLVFKIIANKAIILNHIVSIAEGDRALFNPK